MVATVDAPVATGHAVVENGAINLVRIVAALAVVLSHAKTLLFVDWEQTGQSIFVRAIYALSSLGHQAVVVFFVLSGFWVGGAVVRRARTDSFRVGGYFLDRVTRLWVVLIPALILTAVLDTIGRAAYGGSSVYVGDRRYGGLITTPHPIDAGTFLGNAGFVGNIHVPTYGSNTALWSLGYEFWMYVVGAAVVVLVLSRRRSRWWFAVAAVVVAAVVLKPGVLVYVPVWLAGALVAAAAPWVARVLRGLSGEMLVAVRVVALVGTLGVAVVVRALGDIPVWLADYALTVPAALLVASLVTGWHVSDRSPVGRISHLAGCSYSLYAIHLPILMLLTCILGVGVADRWQPDLAHLTMLAILLVGVTGVAWVFAQGTERHTAAVRHWAHRLILRERRNAPHPAVAE